MNPHLYRLVQVTCNVLGLTTQNVLPHSNTYRIPLNTGIGKNRKFFHACFTKFRVNYGWGNDNDTILTNTKTENIN